MCTHNFCNIFIYACGSIYSLQLFRFFLWIHASTRFVILVIINIHTSLTWQADAPAIISSQKPLLSGGNVR